MTHLTVHEWGRVKVGSVYGFTRAQAEALQQAARAHPLAEDEGENILVERRGHLAAKQMVGVIAAAGCSFEILPKVDPELSDGAEDTERRVRERLVSMLDVAYGLDIGEGAITSMARKADSLLEIFIRLFADRLLQEARRGLPRAYVAHEEDLPRLRGQLDVARQFTAHVVRPDRLACRFDELTSDIALMQIMKAAILILERHARTVETRRQLMELRFVFADIRDLPASALPWAQVRIDRTNRRWQGLLALAKMFLKRNWQATHHAAQAPEGITLLFPMNLLFEAYVEAMLRRALSGTGIEVTGQGGLQFCLGDWNRAGDCHGNAFQTKPDIILKKGGQIVAIIDAKWKRLAEPFTGKKKGVQQADVYQLMAYARVYWPPSRLEDLGHRDGSFGELRLMLLYPSLPFEQEGIVHRFGIHGGREMLALGRVDVSMGHESVRHTLSYMAQNLVSEAGSFHRRAMTVLT